MLVYYWWWSGFVIIGGGRDKMYNWVNKLHVLDIREDDEYKLVECDIKVPMDECFKIGGSGGGIKNEILVVGWIKEQFKKNEFKGLSLPPMYIMQLIALWYYQEMIHCVELHCVELREKDENADNSHYCIKLKHILSSLI